MHTDISEQEIVNLMGGPPDVGSVLRARATAKHLSDADLAIIDKRRPEPNKSQVMNIIGDVSGRDCLLIDDIVDTASTLCMAAKALKDHGAATVRAYCTHPVLSGLALDYISGPALDELVVTDTVVLSQAAASHPKIRVISLSQLLAEAIHRICESESVSSMFLE